VGGIDAKIGIIMARRLFLVIMLTCFTSGRDYNCRAQGPELTFADANSLRDQALAYSEQIARGDCLVREIELFEAESVDGSFEILPGKLEEQPTGILIERTTYYRSVFDFEREKFAIYRLVEIEAETLTEPIGKRPLERYCYGATYDSELDDKVHRNAIPGGHLVTSRASFSEPLVSFLGEMEFCDCRSAFMSLACAPHIDFYRLQLQRGTTGDTTAEVKRRGENQIEIVTPSPSSHIPEGWRAIYQRRHEILDIKSGFRLSSKSESQFIDSDGRERNSLGPRSTWTVEWIGKVPVVIAGQVTSFEPKGYNGRRYFGNSRRRYDFHWIRLNERPDDTLFAPANLESADKILRLLDPEKVGADKLLRRTKPQIGPVEQNDQAP